MRPRPTQVRQDVSVVAAGVLQRVGQHGEAGRVERAGRRNMLLVSSSRDRYHAASLPRGIEGLGTERITEEVTEQGGLSGALLIEGWGASRLGSRVSGSEGRVPIAIRQIVLIPHQGIESRREYNVDGSFLPSLARVMRRFKSSSEGVLVRSTTEALGRFPDDLIPVVLVLVCP